MTSAEVAIRQPAGVAERDVVDGWIGVAKDVSRLADYIAETEFVPKSLRNKPAAIAACILTGRELGIGPMASLKSIHMVQGVPSLSAEYKRARALAAGHQIVIDETTATRCVARGRRASTENWLVITWTMDHARKARLDGKDVWKQYPQRMLQARATGELCDLLFPDATLGLPTTEELEDGGGFAVVSDEAVQAAPASAAIEPPKPAAARTTRRRATPAAAVPDGKPASGPAAAAEPSPAQAAAGLPPLPGEDEPDDSDAAVQAVTDLFDELAAHADHQLKQVGRCVYCVPCNARLYQGRLPSAKDREELRAYARQRAAENASSQVAKQEEQPSAPGDERHRKLAGIVHQHFKRLGFADTDRAERLWAAGKLAAVKDVESLSDLDPDELSTIADALARCKDRKRLEELLAAAGQDGGETP